MSILHSLVLGALQGISEFFPISSSAHLTIFPWLAGWDDFGDDDSLRRAFDVALHLGTALALVVHLRKGIYTLVKDAFGVRGSTGAWRFIGKIAIASVPAAIAGIWLSSDSHAIWTIATFLIGCGLLLSFADAWFPDQKDIKSFTVWDAVIFGLAQAVALWPGVSRSGAIITASRARGFSRLSSVNITFWMAIPILIGAAAYKFIDIGGVPGIPSNMRPAFVVGFLVSAFVGFITLKALVRLVQKLSFTPLVIERVLFGALALILLATPFR